MEDMRGKILELVRMNGPSLPVHISKRLGGNTIFAGAMLSELIARKQLKITNAKVGGSPLYYVEGQEYKLGNLLYPHLKEVHKKAYDLLNKEGILRDAGLEPWQRVALRELGDFAKPLTIYNGEIFWKWFSIADSEAEARIKQLIGFKEESIEIKQEDLAASVKEAAGEVFEQKEEVPAEGTEKKEEMELGHEIQLNPVVEVEINEPLVSVTGVKSKGKHLKYEEIAKPEVKRGRKKALSEKMLTEKKEEKELRKKIDFDSFSALDGYFSEKDIEVLEANMIKKNMDYEFVVNLPSNVGNVKFFVKYRNKKSINEGELSLAQNSAYLKRLPLLFLSNGNLTAKGREYAGKNFIVFERI